MEERRKIVIPTDFDPEETLSRKYFDTEATLAARPVVPLSEAEAASAPSAASSAVSTSAPAVAPAKKSARRWVVPSVIAAALVIGLAAGVGVIAYQRRQQPQQAETPQAVSPVAEKNRSVLPWTHTPDEVIPEEDSTATLTDADSSTAEPKHDNTPHENEARADVRDEKRREREEAAREDRQAQLEQQREEREDRRQDRQRRRGRDERNRDDDLPQDPIRRTQDELHRVREIFEGRP
jgi:hypothetical protein